MMLRTHPSSARRGLALGLAAALLVTPTTPAQAGPAPSDAPADGPDAGDGDIPDEPLEPGQLGRAGRGDATATATATPARTLPASRPNRGSVEVGLELSDQADRAFDSGDYVLSARLYSKSLEMISENETNHMTRSVVLANAVTSYQQLYASTREVSHLRTAQRILQEYLRACKTKHGVGCERFAETQEARARLLQINSEIDVAAPIRQKIPPEIGAAPGGKPYDLTVQLPPPPSWIIPTIVGGLAIAGGGSALIYYAATADKYGPIYNRDGTTTGDSSTDGSADTDGSDTDGSSTTTTTSSADSIELAPETKGKLLIGVGAFLAAAGIGLVVLGGMRLAKHRRLNRERAQTLAIVPSFGRGSAGLTLTGRF